MGAEALAIRYVNANQLCAGCLVYPSSPLHRRPLPPSPSTFVWRLVGVVFIDTRSRTSDILVIDLSDPPVDVFAGLVCRPRLRAIANIAVIGNLTGEIDMDICLRRFRQTCVCLDTPPRSCSFLEHRSRGETRIYEFRRCSFYHSSRRL